jgi:hypothetical protein
MKSRTVNIVSRVGQVLFAICVIAIITGGSLRGKPTALQEFILVSGLVSFLGVLAIVAILLFDWINDR